MGTFTGHVLPGSFFFAYGAWVMYNVFTRYIISQRAKATRQDRSYISSYRNLNSFSFSYFPRVPLEGIFKILLTSVAFIGECITGFRDGQFVNYENAHHMTMYFFFGLAGVFDILISRGLRSPPNMDYLITILAFSMEALLFAGHLEGRPKMDIQVHMFQLYLILLCIVSSALEMVYSKTVIPALMRAYGLILQGTWFIQIGFILYQPLTTPWDQNGPRHMMLITTIYCWHFAGVLLFMMLAWWITFRRVKKMPMSSLYYQLRPRIPENENQYHQKISLEEARDIIAESEEEV